MASINSCRKEKAPYELLQVVELNSFPSASAIEFHNNTFYLIGDDAASLLLLDTDLKPKDSIRFAPDSTYRISKETKPDLESAAIIPSDSGNILIALGSHSGDLRKTGFAFPLQQPRNFQSFTLRGNLFRFLPETNIEGLAFVKEKWVFANRANTTHVINHLLIGNNPMDTFHKEVPHLIGLSLPPGPVNGISGLYYDNEKDVLYFTLSQEETPNAMEDGTIGESSLGLIRDFSTKMKASTLRPENLIELSKIHSSLSKQKIESVCLQTSADGVRMLVLAADNDKGQSRLFRLKMNEE